MAGAVQGKVESPPPLDRQVVMVATVVVLGAIMTILDATIVSVAIETLSRDFNSPLSTIQWVMTGYVLALAGIIPVTGWAMDRFGGKRVWMFSLALFVGASILCGLAWSVESLIVFRVIQGLGGGMVAPAGMSLVAQAAGPQRMGRAMSIVSVPMMLGPVAGPVIGGVLVSTVSWHWIFYINVPIGAVALLASWKVMANNPGRHTEKLDWIGLALLPPGLALLVFGVSELSDAGGFGSTGAQIGLWGGIGLIIIFIIYALQAKNALLDLRHFAKRGFMAAGMIQGVLGITLHGCMLLFPLYYQIVRGASPLTAGLLLIPQGVGAALSMAFTGKLVDRGAGRLVVLSGVPLMVLGFVAFTQVSTSTSYVLLSASLFVMGIGTGCMVSPVMAAAYQAVDRMAIPRATATLNITQRVGGAIGTALYAVVLDNNLANARPAGSSSALADAFGKTFWWPLVLTAVVILPVLLLPKAKPAQHGGGQQSAKQPDQAAGKQASAA